MIRSAIAFALYALSPALAAQDLFIGRLTTSVTDLQLNAGSRDPSLSADGGWIAFVSSASNLGGPSNGSLNVYLYWAARRPTARPAMRRSPRTASSSPTTPIRRT